MVEGEAAFKAGHIIMCGYKINKESNVEIYGLCLQTSNLKGKPHNITILLQKDVQHWKCVCSCKAGQGAKCKHIVAVILYLERHDDIEELSQTDTEQLWGGVSSSTSSKVLDYTKTPTAVDFCHPNHKKEEKTF